MTKTMTKKCISILIVSLSVSGCATVRQSTLLGAGTLGAIGTGVGAASSRNAGGAFLGLGIGAVIGGALGYFAHKNEEEKERMRGTSFKKEEPDQTPLVSAPEIRRIWIPEKEQESGARLEAGHWLWVISTPSRFTR